MEPSYSQKHAFDVCPPPIANSKLRWIHHGYKHNKVRLKTHSLLWSTTINLHVVF